MSSIDGVEKMQPQPQPQPQPGQVQLSGGVFPQSDGTWMVGIWFKGFTDEKAAHHMSGQLEQVIKMAFAPPAPKPEG
jgi:hypothetical protein